MTILGYSESVVSKERRMALLKGPSFKRNLFAHQEEFLDLALSRWGLCDRMRSRGGAVVSSHMGSGKTVMSMCLAFAAAVEGRSSIAIVPTAVKSSWMCEAALCLEGVAVVVDSASVETAEKGKPLFVVSTHGDLYKSTQDGVRRFPKSMIMDDVQHVFVDEAHNFPTVEQKTSRLQLFLLLEANKHRDRSMCVWPITGTPFASDDPRNLRSIRSLCSMVSGNRMSSYKGSSVPLLFRMMFFVPSIPVGTYPEVKYREVVSDGFKYPDEVKVNTQLDTIRTIAGITMKRNLAQSLGCFMGKVRDPSIERIVTACGVNVIGTYRGSVWGYTCDVDFRKKKRDWSSLVSNRGIINSAGTGGTKIDMIKERLRKDRDENGGRQPKTIIFSEHRAAIDQYVAFVRSEGVKCAAYHGDVTPRERNEIVEAYLRSGLDIIVMQIQAGGCGLNLGNTKHVYLTTPSWDPGVEDQAVARAVRADCKPGHSVCVTRFRIAGSIEDDVLSVSSKKRVKTGDLNRVIMYDGSSIHRRSSSSLRSES